MLSFPVKDLLIWQKSMSLAKYIYLLTKQFPRDEMYGLTAQARRAAVSIASNLAEGSQRSSNKEFANFISIARGSLMELETQCLLARDIGYISEIEATKVVRMTQEIWRMMHSFSRKLATRH
jgi:four helix bundle protein